MIRIAAFKVHKHDPLGFLIQAETRGQYTHIAVETDRATRAITEAYYPNVHQRQLSPTEITDEHGNALIDFFSIKGLTPEIEAKVLTACAAAVTDRVPYSIEDLFRMNPFFRMFLGEAKDSDPSVICSAFAHHVFLEAGLPLLNCHSYEVDPYRLTWSTQLVKDVPQPTAA